MVDIKVLLGLLAKGAGFGLRKNLGQMQPLSRCLYESVRSLQSDRASRQIGWNCKRHEKFDVTKT